MALSLGIKLGWWPRVSVKRKVLTIMKPLLLSWNLLRFVWSLLLQLSLTSPYASLTLPMPFCMVFCVRRFIWLNPKVLWVSFILLTLFAESRSPYIALNRLLVPGMNALPVFYQVCRIILTGNQKMNATCRIILTGSHASLLSSVIVALT